MPTKVLSVPALVAGRSAGGGGTEGDGVALGGDQAVTHVGVGHYPDDARGARSFDGAEKLGFAEGGDRPVGTYQPVALAVGGRRRYR